MAGFVISALETNPQNGSVRRSSKIKIVDDTLLHIARSRWVVSARILRGRLSRFFVVGFCKPVYRWTARLGRGDCFSTTYRSAFQVAAHRKRLRDGSLSNGRVRARNECSRNLSYDLGSRSVRVVWPNVQRWDFGLTVSGGQCHTKPSSQKWIDCCARSTSK